MARNLIVFVTLLSSAVSGSNAQLEKVELDSIHISGNKIRNHMVVLADDRMQGRKPGTLEYSEATAYVSNALKLNGVPAANIAPDYLQDFEILEATPSKGETYLSFGRGGRRDDLQLIDLVDFVSISQPNGRFEASEQEAVYVGYGIVSPAYGVNDYDGVDARGKIVIVKSGAPDFVDDDERSLLTLYQLKWDWAKTRGATGLIIIADKQLLSLFGWSVFVRLANSPHRSWADATGQGVLPFVAFVSPEGARKIEKEFDLTWSTSEASAHTVVLSDIKVSFRAAASVERFKSANVVGVVHGCDEELRNEYIALTAHLDHIGTLRNDEGGDHVFNGAYDNAAGVGVVLEVSRIIARSNPPLRRSVLIVLFTAEEGGMVGSDYFANNLQDLDGEVVANINIDMPYLGFPFTDIEAYGTSMTSIETNLREAVNELGLHVSEDSHPELLRLARSDQYSLIRAGIPAIMLNTGTTSIDSAVDGATEISNFMQDNYHQVSDDLSLPFDHDAATLFASAVHAVLIRLANGTGKPDWRTGSLLSIAVEQTPLLESDW